MLTFPNAKINLGLNVLSRRPDGYHNLETVMIPIPSYDILEVVEASDGTDSLHSSGRPVDCPMEKNLVYKALCRVRKRYDIPPVTIYLDKQTPDGAGLGGGSADAAFMIKNLNDLYRLGMADEEMAAIAAEIGADCPFFIYNRPMMCTGTGTDLSPFPLDLPRSLWIVIVKPAVSVSTREAYAGLTPKQPVEPLARVLSLPIEQWQGRLVNDFEESVFVRYPEIGRIKQQLIDGGAVYASMSGSGSAMFGLFREIPDADAIKPLGADNCYLIKDLT